MVTVMGQQSSQAERILDTALELAEGSSWEAVHLHQVAHTMGITLDEIREFYPQKDDLVEGWFDRADSAVLAKKASSDFINMTARERLHQVIMLWFLSLSGHRRVTRQMLCYKFELGHVHLQVLGLLRISRTVQWLREAALLKTANLHRIVEEVLITGIYLCGFGQWLFDESKESESTSSSLKRALKYVSSLDGGN